MGRLLAVGVPGGVVSGFRGLADGVGLVRHGDELMYMDAPRYRLWRAAEVAPEPETLMVWAEQKRIADASSLLRILQDAWLVVELGADHRMQAARLALTLTGECLGNGEERGAHFGLAGRGGSTVQLGVAVYEALLRTDGVRPIADVCGQVQQQATEGTRPVVDQLFEALPLLARAGIVRLDLAHR